MSTKHNKHNVFLSSKFGYTLIELSISLTILALVVTGAFTVLGKRTESDRYRKTVMRIAKIEEAIANFVDINGYIPCPAQGNTLEDNSNGSFGVATTYDTNTKLCTTNLTNNVGMVPVRTLGLADNFAYDGWGRKFSYRIATGLGSASDYALDQYLGDLVITDLAGHTKTDLYKPYYNYGAAYVIISHGPNGNGSWLRNSSTTPTAPPNTSRELENADHLSATPNKIYIQNDKTYSFNHIVAYKRKVDLMVTTKTIPAPLKVPNMTCENARTILDTASSGAIPGVTGRWDASTPNTLAVQIYKSAQAIRRMCDNPPKAKPNTASYCNTNPITIRSSNLQLWLDANDPSGNGTQPAHNSVLATWVDKSGNGRNGTSQNNAARFVTNVPNSTKGWVYYNANDYHNVNLSFLANTSYTIIALYLPLSNINAQGTVVTTSVASVPCTGNRIMELLQRTSFTYYTFMGLQNCNDSSALAFHWANSTHSIFPTLWTARYNSSSSNTGYFGLEMHLLGGTDISFSNIHRTTASALSSPGSSGGIGGGFVSLLQGYIAEVIIYNTAIPSADLRSIEGYLIRKWMTKEC